MTQPASAAGWPVEFTALKFAPEFKNNFQLRTFWHSGEYFHLVVSQHESDWDKAKQRMCSVNR